jgi:plastocyanin
MNTHPLRWSRPARWRAASLGVATVVGLAACSSGASGSGQHGTASAGAVPRAASPAASTPTTPAMTGTTDGGAMATMAGMAGMAVAPTMAAVAPPAPAAPPVPGGPPASTIPGPAAQAQVGILNFAFTPAKVTIKAGQAVRWTNQDAVAHTVDFSGHISNVLNRGDSYTQIFSTPGTYHYICSIHPFMHGTVVVTA